MWKTCWHPSDRCPCLSMYSEVCRTSNYILKLLDLLCRQLEQLAVMTRRLR